MLSAMKRLSLGLTLIAIVSAILLLSDLKFGETASSPVRRMAIFQLATRPLMDDAIVGIFDGLAERGYADSRNLRITRFNAEGDMPTANSIAKAIVDGEFELVATVSTPVLQTMASANRDGKLLQVFGVVTDPFGAGVGISRSDPLDHPQHLVGIGTFQPVRETFLMAGIMFPGLRTAGIVMNPGEACSQACTEIAAATCAELGISLLISQVDNSANVLESARSLAAQGAQALFAGGDNTVGLAITSVIKAADEAKIPVVAYSPDYVSQGALVGLGADYYEVGVVQGRLIADLLEGLDPRRVRIENVMPEKLALRLSVLKNLRDPWHVPRDLLERADILYDESGKKVR